MRSRRLLQRPRRRLLHAPRDGGRHEHSVGQAPQHGRQSSFGAGHSNRVVITLTFIRSQSVREKAIDWPSHLRSGIRPFDWRREEQGQGPSQAARGESRLLESSARSTRLRLEWQVAGEDQERSQESVNKTDYSGLVCRCALRLFGRRLRQSQCPRHCRQVDQQPRLQNCRLSGQARHQRHSSDLDHQPSQQRTEEGQRDGAEAAVERLVPLGQHWLDPFAIRVSFVFLTLSNHFYFFHRHEVTPRLRFADKSRFSKDRPETWFNRKEGPQAAGKSWDEQAWRQFFVQCKAGGITVHGAWWLVRALLLQRGKSKLGFEELE